MSEILQNTIVAVLVWLAGLSAFLYALQKRWFSRFENGFFLSLIAAIAGVAILTTAVIGVWGYGAAKASIVEEILLGMRDIGGIVESEVKSDLEQVHAQLGRLADSLAVVVAEPTRAPLPELREKLDAIQSFDPHYLQLRILDENGRLVVESAGQAKEPLDRVAVAYALEGKPFTSDANHSTAYNSQIIHMAAPIRTPGSRIEGVVTAVFDLQDRLSDLVGDVKFNQSGYAVVVDGDGHVLAHPDRRRLQSDVSQYPAVQLARQTRGSGHVVATSATGVERLFVYRALDNPSTTGREPWVLLTEINEGEEVATLLRLRNELLLGGIVLLLGSLAIAHQMSRSIRKPLDELREFAGRIGAGDLGARTSVTGRDVAGTLATALNDMATGLRERDRVKEVFGRYIATQVSEQILKSELNLGGEARTVTILFSDIRNFSGMSEQLTPQQVVTFLNAYFSEMVDAVFEHGGVLDKFMGDGLLAVFGSLGDQPDHARRAVLAGLRMKALLGKINGERSIVGKEPVAIGIGIHTDEVVVGNIGSTKRLEYTVVGDGVNAASRVQTLNKQFGTTILITETTYQSVKDEFECRLMPETPLRGKQKPLRFYEVVSRREARAAEHA
jgi:class 3 adenylate cyclase